MMAAKREKTGFRGFGRRWGALIAVCLILAILAASTFQASAGPSDAHLLYATTAVAVTVAVHLLAGRRTLLSVGAGTLTYVLMLNLL